MNSINEIKDFKEFLSLFGLVRVIFFTCFLLFNAGFISLYIYMLEPMIVTEQGNLRREEGNIRKLKQNIAVTKKEIAYVKKNIPQYKNLEERGFFREQDRFNIGRMLEDIRKKTQVGGFAFSIGELSDMENSDAEKAGKKLVKSQISIRRINTSLDIKFYRFLQELTSVFPEKIRIREFKLSRKKEVSEQVLQDIIDGKLDSFVDSSFIFDWITLIPQKEEYLKKTTRGRRRRR